MKMSAVTTIESQPVKITAEGAPTGGICDLTGSLRSQPGRACGGNDNGIRRRVWKPQCRSAPLCRPRKNASRLAGRVLCMQKRFRNTS